MQITQRAEIQTSSKERTDRLMHEIMGRLLVIMFILLLIGFSYFSLV